MFLRIKNRKINKLKKKKMYSGQQNIKCELTPYQRSALLRKKWGEG